MRSLRNWLTATLLLAGLWTLPAQAICRDQNMMDPINDIVWDCIFPISIAGIPIDFGNHPPDNQRSGMFCECEGKGFVGFGFLVSFWEPARMVETTSDPWCFPGLGMELDVSSTGLGYQDTGALRRGGGIPGNLVFQHYHYYVTPIWALLDLFTDIPCLTDETTFDLAMVSEVRPDWGDDLTAAQYYPETSLMANPFTVLACMADAAAAVVQKPIDALYWCIGGWGTTYPMTGHVYGSDYVVANAQVAAKAMFVQARTAMLPDRAVNYCSTTLMPIWVKSHWRIQEMDPVVDKRCHLLGYPGILWTHKKNPVGKSDNFSWMLFRKVECCVVLF